MVSCINRKTPIKPYYNDGSVTCNFTERFVSKDVSVNGVISKVASVQKVDMSKTVPLPSVKEYDLKTMLENGYKPQQLNVRGVLGQYDYSDDFAILEDFVIKSQSAKSQSAKVVKSDDDVKNE